MRHQSPTLNNVADAATQLRGVFGDGVFAVDQNFARGGFDESVDHFYRSSFAAAGRPAKHHNFTARDGQVHAGHGGLGLARLFFAHFHRLSLGTGSFVLAHARSPFDVVMRAITARTASSRMARIIMPTVPTSA